MLYEVYWTKDGITYSISADTPPVKDCAELERLGITDPGYYYIDPTGERKYNRMSLVYCENGWTNILIREDDGSSNKKGVSHFNRELCARS